jgi:hypothetical protein
MHDLFGGYSGELAEEDELIGGDGFLEDGWVIQRWLWL